MEKNKVMDFIVKSIRRLSILSIVGALFYLGSEGELGANEVTALSTISPLLVIVVTYMFEVLRWILPKAIVGIVWKYASTHIGTGNTNFLKDMTKNLSFAEIFKTGIKYKERFDKMEETISVIRSDQEKVG